jgi:hypothetical protein
MEHLMAPISTGELFDKISILLIKSERIKEPSKLNNVHAELKLLQAIADERFAAVAGLSELCAALKTVNEAIWEAEDLVRECERLARFDEGFVATARSTYVNNDRRAAIKRQINILLGSRLVEEKSHAAPP